MKNLFYKNYFSVVTPSTGSNEILKINTVVFSKKSSLSTSWKNIPLTMKGAGPGGQGLGFGIWGAGGQGGRGWGLRLRATGNV